MRRGLGCREERRGRSPRPHKPHLPQASRSQGAVHHTHSHQNGNRASGMEMFVGRKILEFERWVRVMNCGKREGQWRRGDFEGKHVEMLTAVILGDVGLSVSHT